MADIRVSRLSVEEVSALLLGHFHVEEEVVQKGFKKVDGKTLRFFDESDLENAGIKSRPLRRRILQECKEDLIEAATGTKYQPLVTTAKKESIFPRIFSSRVQSLSDIVDEEKAQPRRRSSLGTIGEKPPQRRGSGDWLRRSFGRLTSEEAPKSRRDARLAEELKKYHKKDMAFEPLPSDTDDLFYSVRLENDIMNLRIPKLYPFQGPVVSHRGYDVHFEMGKVDFHDADSHILHLHWTPAQHLNDAVVATLDAVRRVDLEDNKLVVLTTRRPSSQQQPTTSSQETASSFT